MSISGNLRTMELAELLQWLSQSKKTGTLIFDNGEVEKRIFFKDGFIISSSSTNPNEHLGHFLVSHGFITEEELSKAIGMQEETKSLLGKILVNMGAITEEELYEILRMKTEESLYNVFEWEEGEFRFIDNELPPYAMIPIKLDVTGIILEGMQRLDEIKRLRQVIPNNKCIPVSVTDLLEDPELDEAERFILSYVDDNRTIEEICLETHSSEYHVSRIIFAKYKEGKIKIVKPRFATQNGIDEDSVEVSSRVLLKNAYKLIKNKQLDKALRYLKAAKSIDPYDKELQQETRQAEMIIKRELEKMGIKPHSIPKLKIDLTQLTSLNVSPQEGFILSRINGIYDVDSIAKISPFSPLEAYYYFWKLKNQGLIEIK